MLPVKIKALTPQREEGGGAPYLVVLGGGDRLQLIAADAHHLLRLLHEDGAHPALQRRQEVRGTAAACRSVSERLRGHREGLL